MTDKVEIFKHPEFGSVRTVEDGDVVWFVGKDVAISLGYKDPVNALKLHVDDEDKLGWQITTSGQRRNVTVINESGLYSLVLSSKLPSAKAFKRWITAEVLPSIRKHGSYQMMTREHRMAIALLDANEIITEQKALIDELKPKADYCERVLQSEELLTATLIAKDYGMAVIPFNQLLHKLEVQFNRGGVWFLYQIYAGFGYMKTVTITLANGLTKTQTRWTQKGRAFIYNLLKQNGILPLSERENPMLPLFDEGAIVHAD